MQRMQSVVPALGYRVMRTRLRASDSKLSPERALSKLRRIQHHRVTAHRFY